MHAFDIFKPLHQVLFRRIDDDRFLVRKNKIRDAHKSKTEHRVADVSGFKLQDFFVFRVSVCDYVIRAAI